MHKIWINISKNAQNYNIFKIFSKKYLHFYATSVNIYAYQTKVRRKKEMKKVLSIVLALVLVLAIGVCAVGCEKAEASTKVKVIDLALSAEEYAFAVNKQDTEFLSKVNAFLDKIKSNGKFDEICNNYFGDGTPLAIESKALDETKDQLVVATSTGFEPFEMVDAAGKYSGVDLEIAYYLAEELNLELVIQDMDFDAVVNSVQSGKSDIAMAGLSVTPAREKVVTFSKSYYNASQVVICPENDTTFDNCKTGEEVAAILKGLGADVKIGCQAGTTGELYIKGDADYGFEKLNAEAAPYKYVALAITAMNQNQVKYVIADNGPAKAIAAKING